MLEILQQFYTYLPSDGHESVDPQLFCGDQLTVERAVNVIASVANGHTPEDRLEGMNFQIGDWHAGVKILSVSFEDNYRKFCFLVGFVTALKLHLFPLKCNHHQHHHKPLAVCMYIIY